MPDDDLDELLNLLFTFAQQALSKHGEFYPFGATISADGKLTPVMAAGEDEHPEPQEDIGLMTRSFRKEAAAGKIRAAGICLDVRTIPPGETEKTDAICARLERQSGEATEVYLPYKKGRLRGFKYGEMFAVKRNPEYFVQGGGTA